MPLLKQEPVLPDAKSVLSTTALGYVIFKESFHFCIKEDRHSVKLSNKPEVHKKDGEMGQNTQATERMGHGESFLRTWS